MQTVILAAGQGTRMLPLTAGRSKPMISVANRPFIDWLVSRLPAGDVVIVANPSHEDLIEYAGERGHRVAFQEKPLGSADALLAAEDVISGEFLMVNGDEFFLREDFKTVSANGLAVAARRVEDVSQFGSVHTEGSKLVSIREKSDAGSGLANCGLYKFDSAVFDYLKKVKKSKRGEYELTDAVNLMAKDHDIAVRRVSEWQTLSCPWNVLDINERILAETGSMIDDSAELRSGAVLEEPVCIGPEAVVGPNCFVRSHSSIGARCKVGQSVEVKNSVIMDNTYVSHLSYVGDSVVGRGCNVAASTIFANLRLDEKNVKIRINGQRVDSGRRKLGGIVGDNVKFGTSVTVMPGKKIWPGIMVPPRMTVDRDLEKQPPIGFRGGDRKGEFRGE